MKANRLFKKRKNLLKLKILYNSKNKNKNI